MQGKQIPRPLGLLARGGGRGVENRAPHVPRLQSSSGSAPLIKSASPRHGARALHGHNYGCWSTRRRRELDKTSYVIDFAELKKAAVEICARFDHGNINEIGPSAKGSEIPRPRSWPGICASSSRKGSTASACGVYKVEVWETDNNRAEYVPWKNGVGRRGRHAGFTPWFWSYRLARSSRAVVVVCVFAGGDRHPRPGCSGCRGRWWCTSRTTEEPIMGARVSCTSPDGNDHALGTTDVFGEAKWPGLAKGPWKCDVTRPPDFAFTRRC